MIVFFRALFHVYKIVIYFFVVLSPNPESKVPVSSGIIWLVQHYSQCLKLCLACRRVFLNNLQRYDYSFLNVIGDKSEAEGGSVACPKSQGLEVAVLGFRPSIVLWKPVQHCLSFHDCTSRILMGEGAAWSSWNFLWVLGQAVLVSTALSDKSWSWSFYTLVSLAYLLFPFPFRLSAQDTHD